MGCVNSKLVQAAQDEEVIAKNSDTLVAPKAAATNAVLENKVAIIPGLDEAEDEDARHPSLDDPRQLSRHFYTENERLKSMLSCGVFNSIPEARFTNITNLMASIFQVPMAVINLFGKDECIFKAAFGTPAEMGTVFERDTSLCDALMVPDNPEVLVVEDLQKDARFSTNPWVGSGNALSMRFYAGAPLVSSDGYRLGTLCVVDLKPRSYPLGLYNTLLNFAELVVRELERDRNLASKCRSYEAASKLLRSPDAFKQPVAFIEISNNSWNILYVNDAWTKAAGRTHKECLSQTLWDLYSPIDSDQEGGSTQSTLLDSAVLEGRAVTVQVEPVPPAAPSAAVHNMSALYDPASPSAMALAARVSEGSSNTKRSTLVTTNGTAVAPNSHINAADNSAHRASVVVVDENEDVPPMTKESFQALLAAAVDAAASGDSNLPATTTTTPLSAATNGAAHFEGPSFVEKNKMINAAVTEALRSSATSVLKPRESFDTDYVQSGVDASGPRDSFDILLPDFETTHGAGHRNGHGRGQARLMLTLRPADVDVLESKVPVGIPSYVRGSSGSSTTSRAQYQHNTMWFATLEEAPAPAGRPNALPLAGEPQGMNSAYNSHLTTLQKSGSTASGKHKTVAQLLAQKQQVQEPLVNSVPTVQELAMPIPTQFIQPSSSVIPPVATTLKPSLKAQVPSVDQSSSLSSVKLGSMVGSGSFARVYRGRWSGRLVAVKVLDPGVAHSLEDLQHAEGENNAKDTHNKVYQQHENEEQYRLPVWEAAVAKNLHHPNIVKTLHYGHMSTTPLSGRDDDMGSTLWIIQEFCDHGKLNDAFERGWFRVQPSIKSGPNLKAVLLTALEIADALKYMHNKGVVHGDLNGNNVLLTSTSTRSSNSGSAAVRVSGGGVIPDERGFKAKVSDFGLATVLGTRAVHTTKSVGTVSHMPPELFNDGIQCKAGDVYALGVILWEMYCGMRAWLGRRPAQIMLKVCTGQGQLDLPADAPLEYQDLVKQCMALDYAQRPTAEEVCERLKDMLSAIAHHPSSEE